MLFRAADGSPFLASSAAKPQIWGSRGCRHFGRLLPAGGEPDRDAPTPPYARIWRRTPATAHPAASSPSSTGSPPPAATSSLDPTPPCPPIVILALLSLSLTVRWFPPGGRSRSAPVANPLPPVATPSPADAPPHPPAIVPTNLPPRRMQRLRLCPAGGCAPGTWHLMPFFFLSARVWVRAVGRGGGTLSPAHPLPPAVAGGRHRAGSARWRWTSLLDLAAHAAGGRGC